MKITKLRNSMLLFMLAAITIIFTSCKKEQTGYKPIKPLVGFTSVGLTLSVADTSTVYSIVELAISDINKAFGYDVYFRFDDSTVVNKIISISHDEYRDPATGMLYYKIPIAQGIKKGAFTFLPIVSSLGNKTFSVMLVSDPTGTNNYTVNDKSNKATITITDN